MRKLLYISLEDSFAVQVETLLCNHGIDATTVCPLLAKPDHFEHFSKLISAHRYIAHADGRVMDLAQLEEENLWVQFGSNCANVSESNLTPEKIAGKIVQELHDHCALPQRT